MKNGMKLKNPNMKALIKGLFALSILFFLMFNLSWIIGDNNSKSNSDIVEDNTSLGNFNENNVILMPSAVEIETKVSVEKDFDVVYLGENFTLDLKYKEATGEVAIGNATIVTNITKTLYTITEYKTGQYWIEFSGECFKTQGIYYIFFTVSYEDYAPASELVEIIVEGFETSAEIIGDDSVIAESGEEFEIIIELIVDGKFVEGANVTYSWIFGTGTLEDIGGGKYLLKEIIPEDAGEYEFKIYLEENTSKNQLSVSVNIGISNPVENTDPDVPTNPVENNNIIIIIGIIATIALMGMSMAIYKNSYSNSQDFLTPQDIEEATVDVDVKVIDDFSNLQGILIIKRKDESYIYKETFNDTYNFNFHEYNSMQTRFLQFAIRFSTDYFKLKLQNDNKEKEEEGENILGEYSTTGFGQLSDLIKRDYDDMKYPILEIGKKKFQYLIIDGNDSRIFLILIEKASDKLKNLAFELIFEFENDCNHNLTSEDSAIKFYKKSLRNLIHRKLHLYHMEEYVILPDKTKRNQLIYDLIPEFSLQSIIFRLAEVETENFGKFKPKSIISSVDEFDKIIAEKIILKFIEIGLFITVNESLLINSDEIPLDPIGQIETHQEFEPVSKFEELSDVDGEKTNSFSGSYGLFEFERNFADWLKKLDPDEDKQ